MPRLGAVSHSLGANQGTAEVPHFGSGRPIIIFNQRIKKDVKITTMVKRSETLIKRAHFVRDGFTPPKKVD